MRDVLTDGFTDWLTIPFFLVAIVLLGLTDLARVRTVPVIRWVGVASLRHVAIASGCVAVALTILRFVLFAQA